MSPEKQEQILSWCLNVANKRVDGIVSNKDQGSYGKAPTLTVACVEVLNLRGKGREAERLISDVRNRFPRHRAFQAELNTAVQ